MMDQKKVQFGGSPPLLHNPFPLHWNPHGLSDHDVAIHLAANRRLKLIKTETQEQAELIESLMRLTPLLLKLDISPALIDEVERLAQRKRKKKSYRVSNPTAQAAAIADLERMKACNFCASMLRIGSWQMVARNEGDLLVKFYFAKKRLVWEVLRNGLKEKIEIKWSDVTGIRASMEEDKPGILEVELLHPPEFYKEIEPAPRKHTLWIDGSDFTEGQAYINRRHLVVFPPGALDKHYERLLENDKRLSELSHRPFPACNSPYFPSAGDHHEAAAVQFEQSRRVEVPPVMQFSGCQSFPQQKTQCYNQRGQLAHDLHGLTSQRSVVNFTSNSNEMVSHQGIQNQRRELLSQGMKMMRRDQIQAGPSEFTAYQTYYSGGNPVIPSGEVLLRGTVSSNNQRLSGYPYIAANPMPFSICLPETHKAATNLLAHQASTSANSEHFNGTGMNYVAPISMKDPRFSNGHLLNYPRNTNAFFRSSASERKEELFTIDDVSSSHESIQRSSESMRGGP